MVYVLNFSRLEWFMFVTTLFGLILILSIRRFSIEYLLMGFMVFQFAIKKNLDRVHPTALEEVVHSAVAMAICYFLVWLLQTCLNDELVDREGTAPVVLLIANLILFVWNAHKAGFRLGG